MFTQARIQYILLALTTITVRKSKFSNEILLLSDMKLVYVYEREILCVRKRER